MPYTQLSPTAIPGRRYSFTAKTEVTTGSIVMGIDLFTGKFHEFILPV